MSRHPDNPYWCDSHDQPIMVQTREEWDKALAAGYLTPEHLISRLENIAIHHFGNEGAIGFDDEGFVVSLVAGSILVEGGVKIRVYPHDHDPPHAHIELRSHPGAKLRIGLADGALMDPVPKGLSSKKVGYLRSAVAENGAALVGMWAEYQGGSVELG